MQYYLPPGQPGMMPPSSGIDPSLIYGGAQVVHPHRILYIAYFKRRRLQGLIAFFLKETARLWIFLCIIDRIRLSAANHQFMRMPQQWQQQIPGQQVQQQPPPS
jgi:hypothetical protein